MILENLRIMNIHFAALFYCSYKKNLTIETFDRHE